MAQFRVGQEEWQAVTLWLDEMGGRYVTSNEAEEGRFAYIGHGAHPLGGDVVLLHWQELRGPLAGQTGIDTLWFRDRDWGVEARGTFFVDGDPLYGELAPAPD